RAQILREAGECAVRSALVTSQSLSRRDTTKIARRFNAGIEVALFRVPKERLNGTNLPSFQSSLRDFSSLCGNPGVETPGYFQSSFQDEAGPGTRRTRVNSR